MRKSFNQSSGSLQVVPFNGEQGAHQLCFVNNQYIIKTTACQTKKATITHSLGPEVQIKRLHPVDQQRGVGLLESANSGRKREGRGWV